MGSVKINLKKCMIKLAQLAVGKSTLLLFLPVFFFSSTVFSQEKEPIEMYSINELTSQNNLKSSLPNYIKPENINPLIYDLKSSIYFTNGTYKIKGENPVRVYLDVNSAGKQISRVSDFDNIEIAIISIESERDLFSRINLENLSGFTKLKYVYIVCKIDCTESQVLNSLENSSKNYVIIYSVEKQS